MVLIFPYQRWLEIHFKTLCLIHKSLFKITYTVFIGLDILERERKKKKRLCPLGTLRGNRKEVGVVLCPFSSQIFQRLNVKKQTNIFRALIASSLLDYNISSP